jgi:hypothetical protein
MLCRQILYGGKTHVFSNKWNSSNQIHVSDILPNPGKELLVLNEYKPEPSVVSADVVKGSKIPDLTVKPNLSNSKHITILSELFRSNEMAL